MSSFGLPEVADLDGASLADLTSALRQIDQVLRAAEVARAKVVALADRSKAYRQDGHRNVAGWLRASTNVSRPTSVAVAQTARLFNDIAAVAEAAADGVLGVDQIRSIAGVYANPRVRDQFPGSASLLVEQGRGLWFDDFGVVLRRWQQLADADGAHRDRDHVWRHRSASVAIVADEVFVSARGGAYVGSELREIFERFTDVEFLADWDQTRDLYGPDAHAALMPRTDRQRRFDALTAIFRAAARSGTAGDPSEPLVNIVVDLDTFQRHLAERTGATVTPIDPATVLDRRCETTTGVVVDPDDVLAAALLGRVRRVVLDSAGVVVDQGRSRRLFTGALRDAVILGQTWCTWPGCDRNAGHCQADHSTPWTAGGATSTANGNIHCGHHNRYKHHHGYRTWRDPTNGRWRIKRPDGTELAVPDYTELDGWPLALAGS